ncbi:MAG: tetratricopeptide repeat protein, partial [Polyangiales bacterium]
AGFGLYLWRLTRKSSAIVDILKGAKDKEGRQQALAQLEASGQAGDAMNALARAQLLAQEKPAEAIAVLEAVDLKKAPVLVQDDVRANLALLYLSTNRVRDARPLVDAMRLDRQPQAQAKALYAAVMAETMARTGRAAEAKKLLQTFGGDAESQGEARALLLRAQVYTYSATKNRGLARQALGQLAEISPMMLAPFAGRGMHPDIQGLARQLLTKSGVLPQAKPRIQRL